MDGEAARLELVNLKVTVPARGKTLPVVRGVSWKIAPGETVCVVGESGAGKSMSMYAAARLEPQGALVEGSVLFNGRDVLTMKGAELRTLRGSGGLGFVFQDPSSSLNPCMSIGAQLTELLRRHQRASWRVARSRAAQLLEDVHIREPERVLRSYPHQLSGGMLQRVVIASALVAKPTLLIADEPTTALDSVVQLDVLRLLVELQRSERLSMIVVTHDLAIARAIADRVIVMYAGRVVEEGSQGELFTAPRHPYTSALLHTSPRLGQESFLPDQIPGSPPDPGRLPNGCPFWPRCLQAIDMCRDQEPPLSNLGQDRHFAACLNPVEQFTPVSGDN